MNNPFQELLGRAANNQMAQGFSQAAGMVQALQNPVAAMFGQATQSNPQLAEVMRYAQQFGGDYQKAFYALAKEKGADPNQILNQARSMMAQQKR